jgi:hypothetical protein
MKSQHLLLRPNEWTIWQNRWVAWRDAAATCSARLKGVRRSLPMLAELAVILLWAVWAGRAYLDFHTNVWPAGGEYPLSVRENVFWTNAMRCGACAL